MDLKARKAEDNKLKQAQIFPEYGFQDSHPQGPAGG